MATKYLLPQGCHLYLRSNFDDTDEKLYQAAIDAAEKAYAPYSKFKVGASALLENDIIITASNQENSAFPSGLCAERVALFYAGSQHPNIGVKKLFITIAVTDKDPTLVYAPCGCCRQVIAETEKRQEKPIQIIFEGHDNQFIQSNGIAPLLPFAFKLPE